MPEERLAGVPHRRADVGEVEVDQARERDQLGDALHALAQDVVGDLEGLDHRRVLREDREELLVRHHDQRVDLGREGVHPVVRLRGAARALEAERLGDDADRERADVAREASDDRSGSGTRASAGAGGHEDHVGALEEALDLVLLLERGAVAELGVRARAQAAAGAGAQMHGHVGQRLLERLKVGVDRHELDAGDAGLDHAVDRVHAGAADADHADHGRVRAGVLEAARVVGLVAAVHGRRGLSVLGEDPGQALLGAGRGRALGDRVVVLDVEDRRAGGRCALGLGLARRGLVARARARAPRARARQASSRVSSSRSLVAARRQRGRLGRILGSLGRAEEVREWPLPHACPLTSRHGSRPPWRAPGSSPRRSTADRTSGRWPRAPVPRRT